LHDLSGRSGEFVAVNIAGFDEAMLADALFGHRQGAYSGADQAREGLVARAADGTLFLDEIGDLSQSDQVKMLRHDNVVSDGAKTLADLGVDPTAMDAVLDRYLYRFRPQGQYTDLTSSAKNLRG